MGSSNRTHIRIMAVLLVGIGLFVYTSPTAPTGSTLVAASARSGVPSAGVSPEVAARARAARANARSEAAKTDALDGGTAKPGDAKTSGKSPTTAGAPVAASSRSSTGSRRAGGNPSTTLPLPTAKHCSDYQWQQDAQAAYVANLNDPNGLDGPPGPSDDDGIACSLLPVDPNRPQSTPAAAKPPPPPLPEGLPETPTIEAALAPTDNYFGVSTPQAPYDWKDFQIFSAAAQKLPSMVEFFQGWDQEFPAGPVTESWRRAALPVISWEPRPTVQPLGPDSNNTVEPGYKLSTIIDGSHDAYIDKYALAVRALGLPVAIRFAHEMNGNWFPWSEERNGNVRGDYVAAWRHVHDRFTAVGATNAIWIWSPNVITARPAVRLAPLYPGDEYVDWMGMVGYYRRVYFDDKGKPKDPTFDNTYSGTLAELRATAVKPVVITELGATEVGGNKPAWIRSLFQGLVDNPDIIGFVWFNHSVNGNDWRIESSGAAATEFAGGVADDRYRAGKVRPPKPGG